MNFLTELYPYQHKAVDKLSKIKVGALYMEQGTGKTRTALELINDRLTASKVNAVLWMCPCSVKNNLKEDIIRHLGGIPDNLIIKGIESLSNSDRLYLQLLEMVKQYKTYLIVDESNLVKNKFATRTDRIIDIAANCTYKLILNGTPISRNEADLFAQWYILDWRILGYKSYYSFAANHLEYKEVRMPNGRKAKTDQVVRVLNTDYLVEKIEPYSYQIKKSEALLDLPQKHYDTVSFSMTDRQWDLYRETKDIYLFSVEDWKAETVYKLFSALQQITSGKEVLTPPEKRMKTAKLYSYQENPRIRALETAIYDYVGDEKCIIFAKYQDEIDDISRILDRDGKTYVEFTGRVRAKKRQENRRIFKDKVQFLLANKQCGAYGLNLQFCRNIIFYSNDFDLATRLQAEDRVHRIGQTREVQIIDIVCHNTIDTFIANNLQNKTDLIGAFKSEIEKWKAVNTMNKIEYEQTSSLQDNFYANMGYLFASKKIRKELGGYPLSNDDNWTWLIAKLDGEIIGFAAIEPQKTSLRLDVIHVLHKIASKEADAIYGKLLFLTTNFADKNKMAITATVPKVLLEMFKEHGFEETKIKGTKWINIRREKHESIQR